MLDPRESGHTPEPEKSRATPAQRPLPDREVPLTGHRTPSIVHAWLDGDVPEAAVRAQDAGPDVEFWKRLQHETETRRQMRTPVYVYQQIMDALPQTTPRVITPWWRRPLELTPLAALAVAAGLVAAGVIVAVALLQLR
ncbi:MAG TPA: hypothetical protein VFW98_15170 [Gemmatimonadaceae bacterium]|nr:hypothetical protein [Gemmatimonadaceae bacterium]